MKDDKDIQFALQISQTIIKYINKELNDQEVEELLRWVHAKESNRILFKKLTDSYQQSSLIENYPQASKEKAWENILSAFEKPKSKPNYAIYISVAAAACMLLFGIWEYDNSNGNSSNSTKESGYVMKHDEDIMAGSNKAILILSDGNTVALDESKDGLLAQEDGSKIVQNQNGDLVYNSSDESVAENLFHTIHIPNGGMYKVILEDGTKVWLNSNSTLKYPVKFAADKRAVKLDGEGYFEVAKLKDRPFIVHAKNSAIEVLGTQFNVNAYHTDNLVKTSLVEGSVKVSHFNKSILLKPGQQSITDEKLNALTKKAADIEQIIDWKNGLFIFRDEDLESIMKRISRWYDIQVDFEDENLKEMKFGGKFSKSNPLSELLKSLELTGDVKFKRQERRVTVTR